MSNILQFHSPEYKQCEELIKQYQEQCNLLLTASDFKFRKINKRTERIFFEAIGWAHEINNKKQQEIIHKRLLNINLNTRAELESRGFYAAK